MPTVHTCSFCGRSFVHGTGLLLVRRDGALNWFCSRRCFIYMTRHKKDPRKIKWTSFYGKERRA